MHAFAHAYPRALRIWRDINNVPPNSKCTWPPTWIRVVLLIEGLGQESRSEQAERMATGGRESATLRKTSGAKTVETGKIIKKSRLDEQNARDGDRKQTAKNCIVRRRTTPMRSRTESAQFFECGIMLLFFCVFFFFFFFLLLF